MTLQELEMIYNLGYIVILIAVCSFFSLVLLLIRDKLKWNYWLFSTVNFVAVTFVTIWLWRVVIPQITKVPL